MQDLQSIAGGRMFGAAVERRLRPLSHHHHQQQSLKCPRCDSTNTKFCYYNNYNLSQPRHFCKGCRRYWTKGGVLRNVPVGGGCRKNKRSKAKQSLPEKPNATAASCEVQTAANSPPQNTPEQKSSSHSGSESSSLTAATTAVAMTTESVSEAAGVASFSTEGGLLNIREYESLVVPTDVPNPDGACRRVLFGHGSENGAFPDIGNFTGLVTASTEPITCGFGFGSMLLSQPSLDTCQQNQWQSQDRSQTLGDLFDRTAQVDLAGMGSVSCDGEFVPLDWQVKDHGAFDLHTTVDQAYWSQGQSQWTYRDQGQNPEPLPSINFSQFHF